MVMFSVELEKLKLDEFQKAVTAEIEGPRRAMRAFERDILEPGGVRLAKRISDQVNQATTQLLDRLRHDIADRKRLLPKPPKRTPDGALKVGLKAAARDQLVEYATERLSDEIPNIFQYNYYKNKAAQQGTTEEALFYACHDLPAGAVGELVNKLITRSCEHDLLTPLDEIDETFELDIHSATAKSFVTGLFKGEHQSDPKSQGKKKVVALFTHKANFR